jgi:hypothetical protein
MDAQTAAAIAIAVAASSELLALSPLRANSNVQLIMQVLSLVFPKRRK